MAAKDYKLLVTAFGTPVIGKVSKRNKNNLTDDRRDIPEPELVAAIVQWGEEKVRARGGHTLLLSRSNELAASLTIYSELGDTLILETVSKAANMVIDERNDQILKHKFDEDHDKGNNAGELKAAAVFLLDPESADRMYPEWWDQSWKERWKGLPEKERIIKAAALLIAEVDRLDAEERLQASLTIASERVSS